MELGPLLLTGFLIGLLGNIAHFIAHSVIDVQGVKKFYEENPNALAEGMTPSAATIRAIILTFVYGFIAAWIFNFGKPYLAEHGMGSGFLFGLVLWLGYLTIEYTLTTFARTPWGSRLASLLGYAVMLMGGGMIAAKILV